MNPESAIVFDPGTPAGEARVERIHRYVSGGYQPVGLMDLEYDHNAGSLSLPARGLITFLRLITNARPVFE